MFGKLTSKQKQRRQFIFLLLIASGAATALVLYALEDNLLFFYSPSQVAETPAPAGRLFNLGGMVVEGSVHYAQDADNPVVTFALTDYAQTVTVSYVGLLPDLFREGQGIVATGKMDGDLFVAERVLAKHDENYMPPEVAESLKKQEPQPIGIQLDTRSAKQRATQ